jgi:hypothetical protein
MAKKMISEPRSGITAKHSVGVGVVQRIEAAL